MIEAADGGNADDGGGGGVELELGLVLGGD
jgi:hypothetical protein